MEYLCMALSIYGVSEIFFRDFYFLLRESQHFEYDT